MEVSVCFISYLAKLNGKKYTLTPAPRQCYVENA